MINWRNTTENLGLILITAIVMGGFGLFGGYFISTKTNQQTIDQLKPIIAKAIDKETIKNEIQNDIDLRIDKIKKSDSLNINIHQIPDNTQKPTNIIISKKDSVPEIKKGFFGRLFSKKPKQ